MKRAFPVGDNPWSTWLWITVGMIAIIDAIWLALTPVSLSNSSFYSLVRMAPCAIFMGMGTWTPAVLSSKPRFLSLFVGMGTLLMAWPALRIYNHLTMTTGFPLADAWLAAGDQTLGFDWYAYVAWLDQYPRLLRAMDYTYTGLTVYSIILFLLLLAGRTQPERSCAEFVKLFLVSAVACSTIGMFFPALSAVIYHGPSHIFHNIQPNTGAYHLDSLIKLRSNPEIILDIGNLPGLVTFPSFHTAMGVIAIYCARRGFVLLICSLTINILMIASTPVFGAHYAVDIVGGALIACTAILAQRWGFAKSLYFHFLRNRRRSYQEILAKV